MDRPSFIAWNIGLKSAGRALKTDDKSGPKETFHIVDKDLTVHLAHALHVPVPDNSESRNLNVPAVLLLVRFSLNQSNPGAASAKPHHDDTKH